VHGFPDDDTVIERDGHIGHGAILHACRVCRNALVGMNAVVNDGAVIGESAFVAALAFVKAGMKVPPRTLVAGIPAKALRVLTDDELAWKADATRQYQELAVRSLGTMKAVDPLAAVEPGRRRLDVGEVLPLKEWKTRRS
jgi:phenylacetic acid degradation protein